MPSKSKNKGSTFERFISKSLNEIFETDCFSRTFGSGAFVGKTNWDKRKGMSTDLKNALSGDVIVPDWFPFNIECKHYDDSPIYHNLLSPTGDSKLNEWLGKSINDAIKTNTIPMVIFKTTRKITCVVIPMNFLLLLPPTVTSYVLYNGFIVLHYDFFKDNIKSIVETLSDATIREGYVNYSIERAQDENDVFSKLNKLFNK